MAESAGDAFPEAMSTSGNKGAGKAKILFGWLPKRAGFVDGMVVYAAALRAFEIDVLFTRFSLLSSRLHNTARRGQLCQVLWR